MMRLLLIHKVQLKSFTLFRECCKQHDDVMNVHNTNKSLVIRLFSVTVFLSPFVSPLIITLLYVASQNICIVLWRKRVISFEFLFFVFWKEKHYRSLAFFLTAEWFVLQIHVHHMNEYQGIKRAFVFFFNIILILFVFRMRTLLTKVTVRENSVFRRHLYRYSQN